VFAMNSMNDQSFFDLAMKVIARHATNEERANLNALLAQEPELRAEFERLETDARVAKDALPLITACTASTAEFPAYARERLQTAVRQTLGRPESVAKEPYRSLARGWRWGLGLAGATAVVLLVAVSVRHTPNKLETVQELGVMQESVPLAFKEEATPDEEKANTYLADGIQDEILTKPAGIAGLKVISRSSTPLKLEPRGELASKQEATPNEPAGHEPVLTAFGQLIAPNGPGSLTEEAFKQAAAQNLPVIQLAIFDLGGDARRADKNEVTTLEETWKGIPIQNFSNVSELQAWRWPNEVGQLAARIVYAPGVREVWLFGRFQGRVFQKTFPLDRDLATTLQQVKAFIQEPTKR
jgi:hypothetical protein